MAKYAVNSESLTAVADAIRAKTGGTEQLLFPQGMVEAIGGISGGGGKAFVPVPVMQINAAVSVSTIGYLPFRWPVPVNSIEEVIV